MDGLQTGTLLNEANDPDKCHSKMHKRWRYHTGTHFAFMSLYPHAEQAAARNKF